MVIQIIGYIAASLTTLSQIPQALRIIKTHHTKDISFATYTALEIGVGLWALYGIFIKDVIVIVANVISFIIVGYVWILKVRYG